MKRCVCQINNVAKYCCTTNKFVRLEKCLLSFQFFFVNINSLFQGSNGMQLFNDIAASLGITNA